jgi:Holliday junction resolvasome RuvABC endonuclease subunit
MQTVLAFDQSYSNIGYAYWDGKDFNPYDVRQSKYGSFRIDSFETKFAKRSFIKVLAKGLDLTFNPDIIVVEQIRMFNKGFAKLTPIVDLAEIISCIVDELYPKKVYAIDSRSWKSKVIGDASADKVAAVKFVKDNFGIDADHDTCDAICQSLYPSKNKAILNLVR